MKTILRVLAGVFLGLVVFAGLLYLLLLVNITGRLQDPEIYRTAFTETDAYNRIYDEVLVDEAVQEHTADLLGGVDLKGQDAVKVLREVIPPTYLQAQTEANIDRVSAFLSYDLERLNLYLELTEPLDRVEMVVIDQAGQVMAELEIEETPIATKECTTENLLDLTDEFAGLSDGKLPESVPSLETLDENCRRRGFDYWIDRMADDPRLDAETARIIENEKDDLRESFLKGDTKTFLEQAAALLLRPVIDASLAQLRRDLQEGDRLDLLEQFAEHSDGITREDIDEQAEFFRDSLDTANGTGGVIALVTVIVGSLLLAAVHLPRPTDMLRWPGLTLLLGGAVCLVVGFVLNSALPGGIREAVASPADYSSNIPMTAISLAGDLAESFARQLTSGFISATVVVLVVGAVLFGTSFFVRRVRVVVRQVLAGSDGGRSIPK